MLVILEQFPLIDDADSDIFIIEGKLDTIEQWCLAFPENYALIAAMETAAYLHTDPVSWEDALQEFASELMLALDWSYSDRLDLRECLLKANQEDACLVSSRIRLLITDKLALAFQSRMRYDPTTRVRRRVEQAIRYQIGKIREIEAIIELLT